MIRAADHALLHPMFVAKLNGRGAAAAQDARRAGR